MQNEVREGILGDTAFRRSAPAVCVQALPTRLNANAFKVFEGIVFIASENGVFSLISPSRLAPLTTNDFIR